MTLKEVTLELPVDVWELMQTYIERWQNDEGTDEPWTAMDNLVDCVELLRVKEGASNGQA